MADGDDSLPLAATRSIQSRASDLPERRRSPLSRFSYTDEEKLFIMHHRILQGKSWQGISREFGVFFGALDKDCSVAGLTNAYHRVREEWRMDHGTRPVPDGLQSDKTIVQGIIAEHKATFGIFPWDHQWQ